MGMPSLVDGDDVAWRGQYRLAHKVGDLASTICTLRARAASSGSWVTITMVVPAALISSSSSITPRAICVSRLPVGSSASSRRGLPARARAMAARCCWPPDSSFG